MWLTKCHIKIGLSSEKEKKTTPTVEVKGLETAGKNWWIFEDINVNISYSNLFKVQVARKFVASSSLTVNILNSTVQALDISGEYQVVAKKLFFVPGTERTQPPSMNITSSRVILRQSRFTGRGRLSASLIHAVRSDITVIDTTIQDIRQVPSIGSDNDPWYSVWGVLHVRNQSRLYLKQVTFIRNGGDLNDVVLVSVEDNSTVTLDHCLFHNNSARLLHVSRGSNLTMTGSTIQQQRNQATYCSAPVYSLSGFTLIQNCTFRDNVGCLMLLNDSVIKNSVVIHNHVRDTCVSCYPPGSLVSSHGLLKIVNSTFLNNTMQEAAVLIQSDDLLLDSSKFTGNVMNFAYVDGRYGKRDLSVVSCVFQENTFNTNTGNILDTLYTLSITDSEFVRNTGQMFGNFVTKSLVMEGCTFHKNRLVKGAFIQIHNGYAGNPHATFRNCTFRENNNTVISATRGKVWIENCKISNSNSNTDYPVIAVTQKSRLNVRHSEILAHPGYGRGNDIRVSDSSVAEFSDSIVRIRTHALSSGSLVFRNNITFIGGAGIWIQSSQVHILGAVVTVNSVDATFKPFLVSESQSSINILNSSMLQTFHGFGACAGFMVAENTSLSITSSEISLGYSSEHAMRVIQSNFSIVESSISGVKFKTTTYGYLPSLLIFRISNGTIDNTHFTNVTLFFGDSLSQHQSTGYDFDIDYSFRCHIVINNTVCDQQYPDDCLTLLAMQENYDLALENSVLRLYPIIAHDSEDCLPWIKWHSGVRQEMMRLFNSTVFLDGASQTDSWEYMFKFMMSSLLTWNSVFANGHRKVHSGDTDFLVKSKSLGLFWRCTDDTGFHINASLIADPSSRWVSLEPDHVDDMFASGIDQEPVILMSDQFCLFNSLFSVHEKLAEVVKVLTMLFLCFFFSCAPTMWIMSLLL